MASSPIRENGSASGLAHERPAAATVPRELLSGIDTLDMTCKQPAAPGLVAELLELKAAAQTNPREAVTFEVGGEYLRVLPKGLSGAWPVALQHRNGIVGVGESANMPAWRISPSAEALHLRGPSGVVGFFTSLLESLTGGPVVLLASRLDTHADIAGLVIGAADVANFVCEADTYAQWCKGDAVQTHWWGPGGVVSARGYDKLAEVAKTGKGGYLLELWGDAVRPGEPITRIEAQVRRRALRRDEHRDGAGCDRTGRSGLGLHNWQMAPLGRIRKCGRGSPTRRSMNAGRSSSRPPLVLALRPPNVDPTNGTHRSSTQLVPMMNGLLTSVGAALGIDDPDVAWRQLSSLMYAYRDDNDRDFAAEVRTRISSSARQHLPARALLKFADNRQHLPNC